MAPHHPATAVESIAVEPSGSSGSEHAIVVLDDAVRVVADSADLDADDGLTLYHQNTSVASVTVDGVPLEVPNLVRRAVKFDEHGEWSAEDDDADVVGLLDVETSPATDDGDEPDECPECGTDTVTIDDPGLPPNRVNVECENPECSWCLVDVEEGETA